MAIIDRSTDFFRIRLYTGNNNAQNMTWVETDTNMKPDLLWIKSYAGNTVFDHVIGDVVRGGGKYIVPNTTAAEVNNGNVINTFNTNGFSVGGATQVSEASRSYVAWGWKASNTTATNTAGSIDSTVSVNTAAGCSVVGYSGTSGTATVGHGLGVAPKMIIFKYYSSGKNWVTYQASLGATKSMYLDENNIASSTYDYFADTEPTSTVFTVKKDGSYDEVNNGSASFIAYCFRDVPSFSKFGGYLVNSSSSNFIYTGFKVGWLMVKQTDSGGNTNWGMFDHKRPGFNSKNSFLYANTNAAEDASNATSIDLLSNGFQLRANTVGANPGKTYTYMAFASNPFVTSTDNNSIPVTAR